MRKTVELNKAGCITIHTPIGNVLVNLILDEDGWVSVGATVWNDGTGERTFSYTDNQGNISTRVEPSIRKSA